MKKYASSEICNLANVTKKSLRHYNQLDLLKPSIIEDNGYWFYNEDDLNRLQLIKNLQAIGFTLSEVKTNLDNNCQQLRDEIPEKLQYIEEQTLQLELTKRLLKKIAIKSNLNPLDAINESLDEEHIEWYKKNLRPDQYQLVEDMMGQPESMDDHDVFVRILISLKPLIKKKDSHSVKGEINKIYSVFYKYALEDQTINVILEAFLKSNLEGPLSRRILSVKEAAYILSLI